MNYFFQQIEWVKQFFQEDNGKASSKRLFSAVIVFVFTLSYFKVVLQTDKLIDIPDTWAMLLGGIILGLGAINKIGRKRDE